MVISENIYLVGGLYIMILVKQLNTYIYMYIFGMANIYPLVICCIAIENCHNIMVFAMVDTSH